MKKPVKKFDLFVNVGIALLTIVVIALLMNRFSEPETDTDHRETRVKLPLEEIDWVKNKRTVILALTEDCGYCDDSFDFYKTLSDQLRRTGNGELLVIFPDWSKAGGDYRNKLGLSAHQVRHEPFGQLGVTGTPTIMLVDATGTVVNKWAGKLGPAEETQVLDQLQLDSGLASDVPRHSSTVAMLEADLIEPVSLKQEIEETGGLIVVDIRTREEFAQSHIPSSRNIPVDELEVRAINELPRSGRIVVYCDTPSEDLSRFANLILNEHKFESVSVLHGGITKWREAGLPVSSR